MPENLLEVEHLTKTYFSDRKKPLTALADLTFSVADAEFLSLVGPSGCGKSTFINLACGIAQPTSGQIRLRGEPITGPISDVGIAFQAPILLEWRTVLQNVLLPIEILERRVSPFHRERQHHAGINIFERGRRREAINATPCDDFSRHRLAWAIRI